MKMRSILAYLGIKRSGFYRIVKLIPIFILVLAGGTMAEGFAQDQPVTIRVKQCSVSGLFDEIYRQTGLRFLYNEEHVKDLGVLDADFRDRGVRDVLEQVLADTDLDCRFEKNVVYIVKKARTEPVAGAAGDKVEGRVVDEAGKPMPGVTVVIEGTALGTSTDGDGKFEILLSRTPSALLFSFVGMQTERVVVRKLKEGEKRKRMQVVLKVGKVALEDVVVTGIFTRRKESFTGSASTYTSKDLKTMGTQNILQSLKTLDPAFAILDDNRFGSDPNRLPNMEIRGKSSMLGLRDELAADPNQPLFILDGFESSLSAVNDLDINRVASITILKDAASTAIYGSKAANGVVVVETVRPEAGRLQVSYNGNVNVSVPDLTSYNLMDAREKLEFEKLAGRYEPGNWTPANEIELARLYNEKKALIAGGVDTYWLSEPLRTGVNQKHSLYVQGGEGHFLFGIGAGYNGNSGVMKESGREVVSGHIDLVYRMEKFQFSNKFSVQSTRMENPIVPFSTYAAANPYYKKTDEGGQPGKWLEKNDFFRAPNPLWNDCLNSRNEGSNLSLSNYFIAEYFPTPEWRARARLGITYGNDDGEKFISPDDTRFDDVDILRKGSYTSTNARLNQVEGELSLTYAKVVGRHRINLVAGGNIFSTKTLTQGYQAQGFPEGDFTYPSFSNGYPENGSPTYYESVSRSANGYFNTGYSFDDRYLLDFSLRTSGSSVFGSSKQYNTTWSVGLGWNLHNERFIRDHAEWIDLLKLRASIGNPGNQSFDSAQTLMTYAFQYGSMNYFGLGAALQQIGNENLEWQVTQDKNIGIDLTLFNKRLALTADYYHKVTDPLLIRVSTPLSSGTRSYMTNAGEQVSQGFTASLSCYVIQDFERRFTWQLRANMRTQKNKVDKIGNRLSSLNSNGRGTNTVRYYDGADPDDIWAVRSAGIDPSNGKELFYAQDGSYTYDFSYDNEVICGNRRPDLEGVAGTTLTWQGLTVSLNFRYQFGADVFNEALYQKVENISPQQLNSNQDRRALYERWQKPGDIVRYKNIADAAGTPMSSRFVQTENVLALESVYLSYEFLDGWIRKLGLSSLKVQASMRDVFRSSTIRSERGIAYPFARTFEAGLSFNF